MKTKLYKKWLIQCKCCDDIYFSKAYKKCHLKYVSKLGDKFFEHNVKHSRFWNIIKVECDLNGWTTKGMHKEGHPLHHYCPSVRLSNWAVPGFACGIDFASMYQTMISIKSVQKNVSNYMRIPEIVFDSNGNLKLSYKKSYKKKTV